MTRDNLRPRDPPMSCSVWCAHTATGETIEVPPESATEGGDLHVQRLRARVARLEHLVAELIEARRVLLRAGIRVEWHDDHVVAGIREDGGAAMVWIATSSEVVRRAFADTPWTTSWAAHRDLLRHMKQSGIVELRAWHAPVARKWFKRLWVADNDFQGWR